MKKARKPHRARFATWCRLDGKPLLTLASFVEADLVRPLLDTGFEWADYYSGKSDDPVDGGEIRLERRTGTDIEAVTFNFDKYHRAAFQVHLARSAESPPDDAARRANLVRRNSQYYQFWGKPWWLPTRFWSESMSKRMVEKLVPLLDQVLAYLERDERGPNISKPVGRITLQPQGATQAG